MFSKNLDAEIKQKKLTNKQIVTAMKDLYDYKTSEQSVSSYRRGIRTPEPKFITNICNLLDIPEQYLFNRDKAKEIAKRELEQNPESALADFDKIAYYDSDKFKMFPKGLIENVDNCLLYDVQDDTIAELEAGTITVFEKTDTIIDGKLYLISYFGKPLVRRLEALGEQIIASSDTGATLNITKKEQKNLKVIGKLTYSFKSH